jgi:hypothetical protein
MMQTSYPKLVKDDALLPKLLSGELRVPATLRNLEASA